MLLMGGRLPVLGRHLQDQSTLPVLGLLFGHLNLLIVCRLAFVYATLLERSRKLVKARSKRRSFRGAQTHEYLAAHLDKLSDEDHDQLLEDLEVGTHAGAVTSPAAGSTSPCMRQWISA